MTVYKLFKSPEPPVLNIRRLKGLYSDFVTNYTDRTKDARFLLDDFESRVKKCFVQAIIVFEELYNDRKILNFVFAS